MFPRMPVLLALLMAGVISFTWCASCGSSSGSSKTDANNLDAADGGGEPDADSGLDAGDPDVPDGSSDAAGDGFSDGDQPGDAPDGEDGEDAGSDEQDAGDANEDGSSDAGDGLEPGRLVIEQLHLTGFAMGESALVIGPDGTSVLIDVGNDSHADDVLQVVQDRLGHKRVDWLILTHYHADHIGAANGVLSELEVSHAVITRGLVDVGDTVENKDFQELCQLLKDPPWAGKHIALCAGPTLAACDGSTGGMPWPAAGCPGLLLGDLASTEDDQDGILSHIDLGAGARLSLYHADGHVALDSGVVSAEAEGLTIGHGGTDPENARSLGGLIRWGDFVYTFDGDMTGADDAPKMEAFVAARADHISGRPLGPGELDVAKLSHHGLKSATSQAWVDWLFPADGADRNAVVGANTIYWRAPAQDVLDRLGPRVQDGYIWVTELGTWPGSHERLREAEGTVVIEVSEAGNVYRVHTGPDAGLDLDQEYRSTTGR